MADTKLADLTALTTTSDDDLLYVVDDPAGTPADRKLALSDVFKRGTVTTSSPVIDAAQTWNASGVTFTGLRFNAATGSSAGSAAASMLMDLQLEGNSRFQVFKNGGAVAVADSGTGTGQFGVRISADSTSRAVIGLDTANAGVVGFGPGNGARDTFIARRAAANLRLGAADTTGTTAPTPQFLSAQSWASSTNNNQTGANFTIDGSQGTGTGAGGSIIFRVAPPGSTSNGVQNALTDALTIASDQTSTFAGAVRALVDGSAAAPSLRLGATDVHGFYRTGSSTMGVSIAGALTYSFSSNAPAGIGFRLLADDLGIGFGSTPDTVLRRDAANTLALRNGANAQEQRVYGSYTSATNFQRMSIKTLRESSGALSGATYVTTIAIPAYANLIGVTTRVTTAVTGATTYDVGDGTDVDLWGAAIGIALGSQSQTADFTAVAAVGAAATSRTVTLTANGSNFTGGVVEICLHYLTTEAD